MKRLQLLLLLCGIACLAQAQTVTFTINTPPCNNDGVVTSNFSGLTPPITVTYYGGSTSITHTTSTTSDVLTGYSGATLYVSGTDGTNDAYGTLSAPPFTITATTTNAACPVLGSATASVSGGVAPYTYQWFEAGTTTAVGTGNPIALPGGSYEVTVTDAAGCVFTYGDSASGTQGIYIYDQPAFSYTVSATTASCTNGTLAVSGITGGTSPFTYSWSNGATTSSLSSLVQGSYNVTVTDANGCDVMNYAYVQQSPAITVNATNTPATCTQNDGASIVFPAGGMPPYSYQWSNGATTANITNLSSAYYTVQVTDANGCTGNGYAYINATTPITVTYSATASSCTAATGTATVSPTGGLAPYTITWNTYPAQTGNTASNLSPGTYGFHVTDANGCVQTGSVYVPPVNIISGYLSTSAPVCTQSNGGASVSVSGGSTPYTYSWSTGGTGTSVSSLAAGGVSVTVTDAIGCAITKSAYLSPSSPISLGLATTPASCIYSADGAITSVASGGTAPYNYSWSNGGSTGAVTGLAAGYYSLYVTDAAGCTASAWSTLSYNPAGTSCYCTLTGTVYEDLNGNCTQDAGENGIPNIQMHCSGFGYDYTDANGLYSFKVPTGSYTLSETVLAQYPLAACQNNAVAISATAATGCVQTNNFGNSINPLHDINISTWSTNQAVPGNTNYQQTIISNQGTVSESAIVAGYMTDGQLGAAGFTPGLFTGAGANYYQVSGAALTPGAATATYADYSVPTNIPLATSVVFKDTAAYMAPVSNWLNDYSPWNNVNYYTETIVGSFDPNFKEVSPRGTGPNGDITYADSVLQYAVHFQNTGTYQAQNIVVLDTLDADLDWSTLRPIYMSHAGEVSITETGVAKFSFKNINLPTQTSNELGSNGMFTYSIKRKNSLASGTQFTNSAAIYFDYNAPVITNTTVNTLIALGVGNAASSNGTGLQLYPNPAGSSFNAIVSSTIQTSGELSVSNAQGQVLITKAVTLQRGEQRIGMDAASLASGIYFVTLRANGATQTGKLVIVK